MGTLKGGEKISARALLPLVRRHQESLTCIPWGTRHSSANILPWRRQASLVRPLRMHTRNTTLPLPLIPCIRKRQARKENKSRILLPT